MFTSYLVNPFVISIQHLLYVFDIYTNTLYDVQLRRILWEKCMGFRRRHASGWFFFFFYWHVILRQPNKNVQRKPKKIGRKTEPPSPVIIFFFSSRPTRLDNKGTSETFESPRDNNDTEKIASGGGGEIPNPEQTDSVRDRLSKITVRPGTLRKPNLRRLHMCTASIWVVVYPSCVIYRAQTISEWLMFGLSGLP